MTTTPPVTALPDAVPTGTRRPSLRLPTTSPSGIIAVTFLVIVAILAIVVPLFPSIDPFVQDLGNSLTPPLDDPAHPLGTDQLGRDILSRLAVATLISLLIAGGAVVISAAIGLLVGLVAGYRGGLVEASLRWVFTVVASVPKFVLVLLVLSIYGDRLSFLAIATGVAYAPTLAEAVFGRIESLRSAEALASTRVESIATCPSFTMPISRAFSSTAVNTSLRVRG